ncbi:hypothetical protein [Sphingomonas sp. RS2018]
MTEPFQMDSQWGAQIEGDEHDIKNLIAKLNVTIRSPASLFVSTMSDVPILRSSAWDNATEASEVEQLAARDLSLIEGCLQVLDGCLPMNVGTIYKFFPDHFEMTRRSDLHLRVRKPEEKLASPIEFGRLMSKAFANDDLRQALSNFNGQPSWFDLYKVWESVKSRFGGEHKIYKALNEREKDIRQFKNTANSFRHVPSFQPIADPITLKQGIAQARALIVEAANGLPQSARPADAFARGGSKVTIVNHTANAGGYAAMGKLQKVENEGQISYVEVGAKVV